MVEKVFLVGAGPGDPELLTIKAQNLLKTATVILYDRLINDEILMWSTPDCKKIYVGKLPGGGDQDQRQAHIISLLVQYATEGQKVVRLKGGDPFLFGRGAEEAIALQEKEIPFEIVPGISSALAAPAYAGIPLTHRDSASSVAIVTGHGAANKKEIPVKFKELARCTDTIVVLMGIKNLLEIVTELREILNRSTPAALIQNGTLRKQRVVTGTLETIVEKAIKNKITPPAILVVGNVVQYQEKIRWFSHQEVAP